MSHTYPHVGLLAPEQAVRGCSGKTVRWLFWWQVGYLQKYLVSGGAEAMYRLVLMLAKSLHHASTANLLVCLPGWNIMLSGCHVRLSPCQVLDASLGMGTRLLM